MVAGIRLNSNVPVFFTNCVIEGCDEGALVTKGSLSIKNSDFISNAQPVDFDGGGDLVLEGNRRFSSRVEYENSGNHAPKMESLEMLIYRIACRNSHVR